MEWLTSEEAAKYLKLSPRTIVALAHAGKLPAHALTGTQRRTWRFLSSELDAVMMNPPAVLNEGSSDEKSTVQ
jgi:excisionase family DNA binding protein